MKFSIDPKIFAKFPGVRIGVLVILGMDNSQNQKKISQLLKEEEKRQNQKLKGVDFSVLPETAGWRETYRQFGSTPHDARSSVEALLRRVRSGNPLPSINPLVDLYNYLSIKHYLPAGAEDLDKVKGEIELTFAKGNETGKYIGSDKVDTCYPGEIFYKDDLGFICRRWNWREADRTKIDKETKNAVLVLEALPIISEEKFTDALKEAEKLIGGFLGGKVIIKVLTVTDQSLEIDFQTGTKAIKEMEMVVKIKKPAVKPVEKINPAPKAVLRVDLDKNSVAYQIKELVSKAVAALGIELTPEEIFLEHPVDSEHGDYATNIALKIYKYHVSSLPTGEAGIKYQGIKSPLDLAQKIVKEINKLIHDTRLQSPEATADGGQAKYIILNTVSVAPPGFINFTLSREFLADQLNLILKDNLRYGATQSFSGKKILLEHTSPNPQTTIMLGHLRNNFLGMSVANILTFLGAKVTKDCVVNDRGIHLCRAILGYLFFGLKNSGLTKEKLLDYKDVTDSQIEEIAGKFNWKEQLKKWLVNKADWFNPKDLNLKPDHANLIWYVLGSRAYSQIESAKAQVEEILISWEKEDRGVWQIWKQILDWSDKGYQQTYQRVESVHDWVWKESEHYKLGKEIVSEGLKLGVFKKSQGAIVTDLKKFNLTDTVVVKTDGTALYLTQDLALVKLKMKKFPSDLYIWDIGQEQSFYFKQLFAVCQQLGFGSQEKFFHLNYALINFKGGGKMATRKGNVVIADEILDILRQRAKEIIKSSNQELRGKLSDQDLDKLAEEVGVAAIKYSLLKYSRETTVFFDIDESLALEGNSGPYIQYTYARCQSVLKKNVSSIMYQVSSKKIHNTKYLPLRSSDEERAKGGIIHDTNFNPEELSILRILYRFPEVVLAAAKNYQPNLICEFLYDLCQKYNAFYNQHRILNAESEELINQRLTITQAVGIILRNGLNLLGIKALEKM